ncbi:hypothetical protein [uncultured Nocardioides sp.]|jgi:hypothetical protein|uniref:hypothetical protein n=1 Tax=uncultured Nocardioides sp. TaxID=198441 RepID=UPI00262ABA71|nr:hypothetical protein [uncultured Nocardioides sp.]
MNRDVFKSGGGDGDSPEFRAWCEAEAQAIERLLALSESMKASDPERAMQIYMYVKRRANELMELDD